MAKKLKLSEARSLNYEIAPKSTLEVDCWVAAYFTSEHSMWTLLLGRFSYIALKHKNFETAAIATPSWRAREKRKFSLTVTTPPKSALQVPKKNQTAFKSDTFTTTMTTTSFIICQPREHLERNFPLANNTKFSKSAIIYLINMIYFLLKVLLVFWVILFL